jgi:hypothetical protein
VRDVSACLRVHPSMILPLLKYGQIPAFHVGGDWRFFIEAMAIPLHREPSAANRNSYTWRNVLG